MIKKIEDIDLVKNIINGHETSINELYNRYKKIIENYISYNYYNTYDFEDIVSEILIKVFENIESFDETKSKFSTWVTNITKHHMCDVLKRKKIIQYVDTNTYLFDELSGEINADIANSTGTYYVNNTHTSDYTDQTHTNYELNDSINTITSSMNVDDVQFLTMKYVNGYNYDEIGREFNVSSVTVSNKVNYIKTKIKNKEINPLI